MEPPKPPNVDFYNNPADGRPLVRRVVEAPRKPADDLLAAKRSALDLRTRGYSVVQIARGLRAAGVVRLELETIEALVREWLA